MGRRSRKRGVISAPVTRARPEEQERAPARRRDTGHRARLEDAPRPPWHPVPLTELCILVGMIVLAAAFLGGGPTALLVGFGLVLVVAATGELALREHLAGYRSHSALVAGLAAILVAAPLAAVVRPPKAVVLGVAAVVFLVVLQLMRELFRRRSGGTSWRA